MSFRVGLLSSSDVSNLDTMSNVIKRYGRKVYATDFCNAQGCFRDEVVYHEGVLCEWGISDIDPNWDALKYYNVAGELCTTSSDYYSHLGVRPVIKFSDVSYMCKDSESSDYGIREILFGEYPQKALNRNGINELDDAFYAGLLNPTGKCYSISDKYFGSDRCIEYEYNGNKYVRMPVSSWFKGGQLSTGDFVRSGNNIWFKVEPIVWLLDEEKDLLISKRALFSGVPMQALNSSTNEFNESSLNKYLNEYFALEIMPVMKYYKPDVIKEMYEELEEINNEMNELAKDEKVKRFMKLLSRNITLTNELKNSDKDDYLKAECEKNKEKGKQLIIDMSERANMEIINHPTYSK